MIINQHKAIFIHIPKTGGLSASKAILGRNVPSGVHTTVRGYQAKHPQSFEKYFKFTFVRSPWGLALSQYNYLWHSDYAWPKKWRAKEWKSKSKRSSLHSFLASKEHLRWSFEEWIKSDLFLISSPASHWCKKCHQNQIDWLLDKSGKVNIDFVGKFENFQEDFDYVCDKIGMPQQQLPHINAGPKCKHYSEYYNDETKEVVAKKYKKDIEYFGYEFGE